MARPTRTSCVSRCGPWAAVLVCAAVAVASQNEPAQRLDPGLSDINSLQTSLRALPPIMRHDTSFEHVYQSPLHPDQRFRVAGGIYAVFNASDYVATRAGQIPVYPAGVQFHIGPPLGFDGNPVDPATAVVLSQADPRFDLRDRDAQAVDRQPGPALPRREQSQPQGRRQPLPAPMPTPTISSESVRQQRLRAITAKALDRAGLGGSGVGAQR